MSIFRYKGFIGSVEIDSEARCLYGKLLYINDLVTYESNTITHLETEFKKAVNDYLTTCKKLGREPIKPFKGSLNVRIGAELHREAALHAAIDSMSLNEYIKTAIQNQIHKEEGYL